jgi:putative intracellular protease/amidase
MKYFYLVIFVLASIFSCQDVEDKAVEVQNTNPSKITVAVFKGDGAGEVSVIETIEALKIDKGISASTLTASQIQAGKLKDFEVLIFPGGSGSRELMNLGESGQQKVRDFVINEGKGVVGICAGAYLLASTPNYPNLKLASAVHIDRAHYNRGRGLVQFDLNKKGLTIFPELENHKLFAQYYDGPVFVQSDTIKGNYNELGQYVSDIHPDDFAPTGLTPGKTFALNQQQGKGKVFLIAGHPESTPGMRWMVARMARWVSGNELVSYNAKWVQPTFNDKEIIFNKELRAEEKKNYWLLFEDNSAVQIEAMHILYALRSRKAVRWNVGLLRSNTPETRALAAKYLMQTGYTDALEDIEQALKVETNATTKKALLKAKYYLGN